MFGLRRADSRRLEGVDCSSRQEPTVEESTIESRLFIIIAIIIVTMCSNGYICKYTI